MDLHDIENQFAVPGATVQSAFRAPGRGRSEVERIIARFGIGVLSCFLCCDQVEVDTKKSDSSPLRVRIDDLMSRYGFLPSRKSTQGTRIRARLQRDYNIEFLKEGVIYYLRDCRYATQIRINGVPLEVPAFDGVGGDALYKSTIDEGGVSGVISLDPSRQNRVVFCQEGILVGEHLDGILPKYAVGIVGYLNAEAGVVDLTASRTEIEENENFCDLRDIVAQKIRVLIEDVVAEVLKRGDSEEIEVLLHHLLEMSYLQGDATGFLGRVITGSFAFETLDGDVVRLDALLSHPRTYYLLEHAEFTVKRCKWLRRFIFSKIDISSTLLRISIPKSNIIFLKSSLPRPSHLVTLLKNYFAQQDRLLTDITEMDHCLTMGMKPSPLGDTLRVSGNWSKLRSWKSTVRALTAALTSSTILSG